MQKVILFVNNWDLCKKLLMENMTAYDIQSIFVLGFGFWVERERKLLMENMTTYDIQNIFVLGFGFWERERVIIEGNFIGDRAWRENPKFKIPKRTWSQGPGCASIAFPWHLGEGIRQKNMSQSVGRLGIGTWHYTFLTKYTVVLSICLYHYLHSSVFPF